MKEYEFKYKLNNGFTYYENIKAESMILAFANFITMKGMVEVLVVRFVE